MNRTLFIGIAAGSVLLAVLVGALMLRTSKVAGPASGAATSTVGFADPNYVPYSSGSQDSNANEASKDAVRAAFAAKIGSPNPDNIKPGETAVVGEYALQNWTGSISAGQALMHYDSAQGAWVLVVSTGGIWSTAELIQYHGVPPQVAISLVSAAARR